MGDCQLNDSLTGQRLPSLPHKMLLVVQQWEVLLHMPYPGHSLELGKQKEYLKNKITKTTEMQRIAYIRMFRIMFS